MDETAHAQLRVIHRVSGVLSAAGVNAWLFPPDSFDEVPVTLERVQVLAMSVSGMLAMKQQYPTLRHGGPWRDKDVADMATLRGLLAD